MFVLIIDILCWHIIYYSTFIPHSMTGTKLDDEVKQSDNKSNFQPRSQAMKDWKNKYLDKEVNDINKNLKDELQSEVYRLSLEEINQRLESGEDISEEEKQKIIEDNLEKALANQYVLSPNDFHKLFCKILMVMAVIGGFFAFLGYNIAPDSCASHDDTIWESLGVAIFFLSTMGVPINIIIWLISLFNSNIDSSQIFVWVFFHIIVVIISMAVFDDYILQDMFCGCWGFPGEDCS